MSQAEAMSNSEEIKPVPLSIVELCLARGISQACKSVSTKFIKDKTTQTSMIPTIWYYRTVQYYHFV